MSSTTKHILVTGGLGFIGSHVCDALIALGHTVTVLDDVSTGKREQLSKGATLIEGDIADQPLVEKLVTPSDAVIHLAAIASVDKCEEDRSRAHKVNAGGAQNVLQAAAHAPKKPHVIYASSAAVYGNCQTLPISESTPAMPLSVYGHDKHFSEKEAAAAYEKHGLSSVGFRFFNVYGERQDPVSPYSGVIGIFARAAIKATPITIFGDGEQTRDFIYVGDIVRLILSALQIEHGAHILNGCTGQQTSLLALTETLSDIQNQPLTITHEPNRAKDIRHSLGCPKLAKQTLGFEAETPLKTGLINLLQWMKHE